MAWRDWHRLLLAQVALLRARGSLKRRPVGSLVRVLSEEPRAASKDEFRSARAWALAIDRAARLGVFRPTCLVRSLALMSILDRAGIRGARIRAGVQRRNGRFTAHAWVELGDQVLTDPESYVAQFEPWADLGVFEDLVR